MFVSYYLETKLIMRLKMWTLQNCMDVKSRQHNTSKISSKPDYEI